jgi:WD40 repeat protein
MYFTCHDDVLWRKLLYADFGSVPPPLTQQQTVMRKHKTIVPPSSTNLKLYQNHMKLGRRWLTGKASTRFLQGHHDSVYCLAWISKDILISGSRDKRLKVWNAITGQCIRTITGEHDGSILSMRVNQEKSILLTGSSDATCVVWSLPNLVPITKLRGHGNSVLDVCFVNNQIVTSSRDHSLRVWDMATGLELRQMRGHSASVNAIEPVGDTRIVSASGDGSLKLWDIQTGECLKTMESPNRLGLACVRYNGKYLYSGGLEGKIRVWDVDTGECVNTLVGHTGMIRSIDYIEVLLGNHA